MIQMHNNNLMVVKNWAGRIFHFTDFKNSWKIDENQNSFEYLTVMKFSKLSSETLLKRYQKNKKIQIF